ncbi:MAG: TIGR00296 family protein [Nanopusillaceae archaeon]
MYSLEDGKIFVKTARKVIENYLKTGKTIFPEEIKKYSEKRGIFTTIKKYKNNELRGCIGFPYPIYPLWKALVLSAISAATEDPRFEPLKLEELKEVIIEINILSEPELIKVDNPEDYVKNIKIGRDGLIVKYGIFSGLLLPEVPVEEKWNEIEFLNYTCIKAGLPPNAWLTMPVKIYKFTSQIFREKSPEGEIEEVIL